MVATLPLGLPIWLANRGQACKAGKEGPREREGRDVMSDKLVIRSKEEQQKLSGIGAKETEVDLKGTVPQRIDKKGTKVEDLAGTGEHDSSGG